jgi:hypothetical protein
MTYTWPSNVSVCAARLATTVHEYTRFEVIVAVDIKITFSGM